MPKKRWWSWKNKKHEDNKTRNNDIGPRSNKNEQSRNNWKKRRLQWSDAKPRTSQQNPDEEGLSSRGLHQQSGPRQQNSGSTQRMNCFQSQKPRPRQQCHPSKDRLSSSSCLQNQVQGLDQCNARQGAISPGTSSSTSSNIGRHIPGFYFDPERKRYFRVLPGHNIYNHYHKENVKQREAESRRLEMLSSNKHSTGNLSSKSAYPSINQILCQRQRGKFSSLLFERKCHELCVAKMSSQSVHLQCTCPDTEYYGTSGYMSLLEVDRKRKKILTVISDDRFHRFWQGTVSTQRNKPLQIDITNWKNINCVGTRCSKVTSAHLVSIDDQEDNYVLYTTSGGQMSNLQLFGQNPNSHHILYNHSEYGMIWVSSWSQNKMLPNHLSLGGRRSYVIDIMTSTKTKLNTNGSEVFCQVFAKNQPLLYNGNKRGEVVSFDLRTPSQSSSTFASILHHKTSVCSVQLLTDENYIITSDMSGKIRMWDIRMCAVAREYHGNNNQYMHLPFKIDSTESILYTVGQDCFTRLWSIKTGDLLKTIPPPLEASKQTFPSVVYSTDWYGCSGLLLATQKQLEWYSLKI